jgi:hypothetical protein
MDKIHVYKPDGYTTPIISAGSPCFYFTPHDVGSLIATLKQPVVTRVDIDVQDLDDELHRHPGATFGLVTGGFGCIKTGTAPHERLSLREGDSFFIPAGAEHLTVAAQGTVMKVCNWYLGEFGDMQELLNS